MPQPLAPLPDPGKVLIAFVPRHRGEKLVAAAKKAGGRGGTIAPGETRSGNRVLQALALGDVRQDVVFAIMGPEADAVTAAVRDAAMRDPGKLSGLAVVIAGGTLFARGAGAGKKEPGKENDAGRSDVTRSTRMGEQNTGHKLLTVIVNAGVAEDVMAAARRAGAAGGSIIGARGTGTEEDVKFFGITLVPEKEMLLIVAPDEKSAGIVQAISEVEELKRPGGGVMFTMNVEEFVVLGGGKR